jgi:hypothetical protein
MTTSAAAIVVAVSWVKWPSLSTLAITFTN